MASWLKNTFLDTFDTVGLTNKTQQTSADLRGTKRKSDGDGSNLAKARHGDGTSRGSSYNRSHVEKDPREPEEECLVQPTKTCDAGLLERLESWKNRQTNLSEVQQPISTGVTVESVKKVRKFESSSTPSKRGSLSSGGSTGNANISVIQDNTQSIFEKPRPSKKSKQAIGKRGEPNTKRRHIRPDKSKRAILEEVREPEYSLRDVEIRDELWHLMDLVERLTKTSFTFDVNHALTESFYKKFGAETVKLISCLASGGPGGVQGWHDLFLDGPKRRALVCAIISNVLVEQVLQHMFFGGIAKHVKKLTLLQEQHCNEDGFRRNAIYASHVCNILDPENSGRYFLPVNFTNHVNHIVGVIWTHIKPIFKLHNQAITDQDKDLVIDVIDNLHKIVTHAGILSLSMRMDPHTVYNFDPVFKEDAFKSQYMDCINHKQMQQTHPRALESDAELSLQEQKRRANIPAEEKKRALGDEPFIQIAIMPGMTAYRRGGWETADSTVFEELDFEEPEYANMGYRTRVLSTAWVYCRWGRERRFEGDQSADIPELHGTAWQAPGFVEFVNVEGIGAGWTQDKATGKTLMALAKGKGAANLRNVETLGSGSRPPPLRRSSRLQEDDLQAQLNAEYGV